MKQNELSISTVSNGRYHYLNKSPNANHIQTLMYNSLILNDFQTKSTDTQFSLKK